jgi:pimeloyl-ACP methyl ester carboxylesterase
VNLFRWEDIEDAVLVAHSYGGWPVSGALEQIGDRVRSVVFVDAFRPENGQRVMDTNSAQFQRALKAALARGEAGRPVPDAGIFGILKPENRAWVQSKMTPQPAGVAVEPIKLTGAVEHVASKTYVRATGYSQPPDRYFANAKADPTWRAIGMDPRSGHDVMIDAPDKLANILEHV